MAKLVHVSTAYVAGTKDGRISEDTPILGYFPRRGEKQGETFSVATELEWYEQFVKETRESRATNPRPVRERLREGGMIRAESWGWTNTYTYTKSMGEQLIAANCQVWFIRSSVPRSWNRRCVFRFPGGTKASRHRRLSY